MPIAKRPGASRREVVSNDDQAAEAFIAKAGRATQEPEDDGRKVPVTMRYDPDILRRVDTAAKKLGISRSAYVHVALSRMLEHES
jgi:predicted HicB family RNase H-like nuclease